MAGQIGCKSLKTKQGDYRCRYGYYLGRYLAELYAERQEYAEAIPTWRHVLALKS